MKQFQNYTQKEQKADNLWSRFNRKNQTGFWQQYEALLKTNQRKPKVKPVQSEKTKAPPKHSAQTQASPLGKQVFRPTFFAYLGGILGVLVFVAVTVFFWRFLLQDDIPGTAHDKTESLIMVYLVLFAGFVAFALHLNVFTMDERYFYIYKPLLFVRFRVKWDRIQAIIIEKDVTRADQGWVFMSLSILTHQNKLKKFKYQLSDTTHAKFQDHLESHIQDVRVRTKLFPEIRQTEH